MLLAKWSEKGAVKHQQYVFLTLQFGERKIVTREIWKREIGRGLI